MQQLVGKTVQFTSSIEDMEAYPENGMRARIVSITTRYTNVADINDHLYIIKFDYSEFDEFNKRFESSNYYDKNGNAILTARQANMYTVTEEIYFGSPKLYPFEQYFKVIDQARNTLIDQFKVSGATDYVQWLEDQLTQKVI